MSQTMVQKKHTWFKQKLPKDQCVLCGEVRHIFDEKKVSTAVRGGVRDDCWNVQSFQYFGNLRTLDFSKAHVGFVFIERPAHNFKYGSVLPKSFVQKCHSSSTKFAKIAKRILSMTLLRQTAAYKYCHNFGKSCLQVCNLCVFVGDCVCNCPGIVNQSEA